jgi:hypothetical protein
MHSLFGEDAPRVVRGEYEGTAETGPGERVTAESSPGRWHLRRLLLLTTRVFIDSFLVLKLWFFTLMPKLPPV